MGYKSDKEKVDLLVSMCPKNDIEFDDLICEIVYTFKTDEAAQLYEDGIDDQIEYILCKYNWDVEMAKKAIFCEGKIDGTK